MNATQLQKITMIGFKIAALGSFVLSLNGFNAILNAENSSFINAALASVIAVVSSILIYIAWKWLFHSITICDTSQSLTAVMSVGLAIQIFVFSVSSVPGTVGLAGQKAAFLHIQKELLRAEALLEEQALYNKSVSALLPELNMIGARFQVRGQAEFETGADTGHPGHGTVADSQLAISARLSSLSREIKVSTKEFEDLMAQALDILQKARMASAEGGSYQSVLNRVSDHTGELRSLLAQMKSQDTSGMIERTLNALPSEIDSRTSWAKGTRLRERQRVIIAKIRDELTLTTSRITGRLDALKNRRAQERFELQPLTAMKATFLYWDELIMVWLTSIMIDSFGYLILCLLLIQLHWLDQERKRSKEIRSLTVEDVRNAKDADSFVSKPGGAAPFMIGMEGDHYGLKKRSESDE
ncbi:MAG: hypothetical protein ABJN40_01590 [Sneathiella sp.]